MNLSPYLQLARVIYIEDPEEQRLGILTPNGDIIGRYREGLLREKICDDPLFRDDPELLAEVVGLNIRTFLV